MKPKSSGWFFLFPIGSESPYRLYVSRFCVTPFRLAKAGETVTWRLSVGSSLAVLFEQPLALLFNGHVAVIEFDGIVGFA